MGCQYRIHACRLNGAECDTDEHCSPEYRGKTEVEVSNERNGEMNFKPGDRVTLSCYTVHNLTDACSVEISPYVVGTVKASDTYSKIKVEFEVIPGIKICLFVSEDMLIKVGS